jgi:hypothetical protein
MNVTICPTPDGYITPSAAAEIEKEHNEKAITLVRVSILYYAQMGVFV